MNRKLKVFLGTIIMVILSIILVNGNDIYAVQISNVSPGTIVNKNAMIFEKRPSSGRVSSLTSTNGSWSLRTGKHPTNISYDNGVSKINWENWVAFQLWQGVEDSSETFWAAYITNPSVGNSIRVKYDSIGTYNGEKIGVYLDFILESVDGSGSFMIQGCENSLFNGFVFFGGRVKTKLTFYKMSDGNSIAVSGSALCFNSLNTNEGFTIPESQVNYVELSTQTVVSASSSGNLVKVIGTAEGFDDFLGGDTFYKASAVVALKNAITSVEFSSLTSDWWFTFTTNPLTIGRIEDPVKSITPSTGHVGDTVTYTINQKANQMGVDTLEKYTSLVFKDTLPVGITPKAVRVYAPNGTEITSSAGSANISGQDVKYTFSSTYLNSSYVYDGGTYKFVITGTVSDNIKGKNSVDNSANITINSTSFGTNTVKFSPLYKITTSKIDAQIDASIPDVPAGSNKTINYSHIKGYYISSLKVDNQEVTPTSIMSGSYTFSNIQDDHKVEVVGKPQTVSITLKKTDKETGTTPQGDASLDGAEYTIYQDADCKKAVETLKIAKNSDGTHSATSSKLPLAENVNNSYIYHGTYYIKETKAPQGYLLDSNVYSATVDIDALTSATTSVTIDVADQVIKNNIELTKYLEKTDSSLKMKLNGAIFMATLNSDNTKKYYSTETDQNGYAIIKDLPYGTYTIVESTVPSTAFDGRFYVGISNSVVKAFECSIFQDKTVEKYVYGDITNIAKKMQITIYKEDAQTGITTQGDAHLENAEYTLYRDAGCTDAVETLTIATNTDGTYSATSGWYLVGTY